MSLNEYRDEAAVFLRMIDATAEPIEQILGWLDEELLRLRPSLQDRPQLAHRIYDMMFLLFELAARYDLDLNEQWTQGRQRKLAKYGPKSQSLPVRVRTCQSEDLPKVEGLYRLLCEHAQMNPLVGDSAPEEPLEQRMSDLFNVAEVEGGIVGFAIGAAGPVDEVGQAMAQDAFPGEGPYLEVQDLFVLPEWRNRGVGSALKRELVAQGDRAGMKRAIVYSSNLDYGRIGRFYEKFGFMNWHLFLMQPPGSQGGGGE